MMKRTLLTPNNRKKVSLGSEFTRSMTAYDKSPTNKQSVFGHARAGRQNSEGFGGGNRVGRR
jgi:hypothetical protein